MAENIVEGEERSSERSEEAGTTMWSPPRRARRRARSARPEGHDAERRSIDPLRGCPPPQPAESRTGFRIGSKGFVRLVALFLPVASAPAADWPQFLGPTRNGATPEANLAASWAPEGPPILWRKEVGQGFSGPVVAGDRLILFHRLADREVVECLDAASGKTRWSSAAPTAYRDDFGFDEGPRATPAIDGALVFTLGAEGKLRCLEIEKGTEVWSVDTREKFRAAKGFFGVAGSPLVEGGRVLVNIGGRDGAGLVAFERGSGRVLWKATDDEASYSSPIAATIGGRRHALFFTRAGLVDADPETGDVRFRFPWRARGASSVNAATPIVVDDLVFISASYQTGAALLKVEGSAFTKVWSSDEALSNHYATSVHRDGYLYGFDGRHEYGPNLRCVELRTGKVVWSQDRFGGGTAILAGERLLILTDSGEVIVAPASPKGFTPAARARILDGTVRAHPALSEGRIYARSEKKLVCADLRAAPGPRR